MRAYSKTKQMTLKVNDEKIKITVCRKTNLANFVGWNVTINGEKFFSDLLERDKAIDNCYVRWVKKHK